MKYTETQIIEQYSKQGISRPYVKCAKSFMKFLKEKAYLMNDESINEFCQGKSNAYRSMIKKFNNYYLELGSPDIEFKKEVAYYNAKNHVINTFMLLSEVSETSKMTYLSHMNKYSLFCTRKSIPFISYLSILQFKNDCIKKQLASSTINNALSALKSLADFCMTHRDRIPDLTQDDRQNLMEMMLIKSLSTKKQKEIKCLNKLEREMFLMAVPIMEHRLILSLMCHEGLRKSELSTLEINLSESMMKVRGKGYRNEDAEIKIFDYSKRLYLNCQDIDFSKYSKQKVSDLTNKYLTELGYSTASRRLTPHSLRHTALQILVDDGKDLEFVRLQARHSDIKTTYGYVANSMFNRYKNS